VGWLRAPRPGSVASDIDSKRPLRTRDVLSQVVLGAEVRRLAR